MPWLAGSWQWHCRETHKLKLGLVAEITTVDAHNYSSVRFGAVATAIRGQSSGA